MNHKRTKIVCTIGPASESVTVLSKLMREGMNVARLNFSHGKYENHSVLIQNIREAATKTGTVITILQDLQGPKIRVGKLPDDGVMLAKDTTVTLATDVKEYINSVIPVQYIKLHEEVKKGDRILLDDGNMEVLVNGVRGKRIACTVVIGGKLISYKGITVPTASLSAAAVTEKDKKDLLFGLSQGIDIVALSFVRSPKDIEQLRTFMKRHCPANARLPLIVAKIEKHEALKNLDAIIAAADGIMVARGDLALETKASEVPVWQKRMIQKCLEAAKPVITATQMLDSMTRSPRPTRAEISDVANAVIDHTDATMLSQESAMGKYPIETVEMMTAIIGDTEGSSFDDKVMLSNGGGVLPPVLAMSAAACVVAKSVNAKAIIVKTRSGFTARAVSRHRPSAPIIAITPYDDVCRQLALSWGVDPYVHEDFSNADKVRQWTVSMLKKQGIVKRGDRLVVVSGLQADRPNEWDEVMRVLEV